MTDPLHTDRGRAEAFGSVAAAYDRFRPSYPDALIEDLVELGPHRVLDVACGTGKLATALMACGFAVLGVDVDPKMAEIARTHGLVVEVGAFETWDDAGRTFDLITCGQGWHWVDPDVADPKAANLLDPGGTLALMWNYDTLDDDVVADFDDVYRAHAPELLERHHAHDDDRHEDALKRTGLFASVETRRYRWSATLTADEWIGRAGTYSDHINLPDGQRADLLAALHRLIERRGGSVTAHYGTYTIFARTPE